MYQRCKFTNISKIYYLYIIYSTFPPTEKTEDDKADHLLYKPLPEPEPKPSDPKPSDQAGIIVWWY